LYVHAALPHPPSFPTRRSSDLHHPNVYYCLTPTRSFYDQRRAMLARLPPPNRWIARVWSASHAWFERRSVRRCDQIIAISENVRDRKSTRLNSSHQIISYAVFC